MEELKIQTATAADLEAVTALWLEVIAEHEDHHPIFQLDNQKRGEVQQVLLQRINAENTAILLAMNENIPVGMTILKMETLPNVSPYSKKGYIAETVIQKEHRSLGIGTFLVNAAKDWIFSQGGDYIELQVSVKNEGAKRFWESQGFFPSTLHLIHLPED
ncbi:GNAT family N-acetyltransferase [bacterium SCSIO 12741]|nr:GNAT family N-acetyltransferase [bacterium SCSIO 12741]